MAYSSLSARAERSLTAFGMMVCALLLPAIAPATAQSPTAAVCAAPLKPALELNLYFGRDRPGGEVSEAEWATFLSQEVTPRFPDGLSVINVAGQSREATGPVEREKTKLLIIVVFDAPAHQSKVVAIVDAYKKRFAQNAVFRV
jgi:hypothetical protein